MLGLFQLKTEEERKRVDQLYRQYRYLVFYKAAIILQDDSLAEDITQDIFQDVIDRYEKFSNRSDQELKYYLCKMAHWRAITQLSRRSREIAFDNSDAGGVLSHYCSTEGAVLQREKKERFAVAIEAMDERYRRVMRCAYLECMTPKQIAEKFNMNLGTVYKQLERGNVKLAHQLKKIREQEDSA